MQKGLIVIGVLCVLAGVLWPWLVKSGLGRLPGDILIRDGDFTFYFPLTTGLLLSVVISAILWLLGR